MSFKFEKLVVWQQAMTYGELIFEASKNFPKEEQFNLVSQVRRAVDSVALNIAEGSIGQSDLEQKKFIGYAMRSLAEVVTCLHKALNRKYIEQNKFDELKELAVELMSRLSAFKKSIN